MVANAFLLTTAVLLAIGFALMGELKFLIPYKLAIWRTHSDAIMGYVVVLFLNVFSAAFVLNRKFFLKDTGRKLSHIDKQFHIGDVHLPADADYDERT